jgi:TRAP-type mannitol/chloroaromatic compound transport system permease large subunit
MPQWELEQMYAGRVQFMILQTVAVGILLLFSKLATWPPNLN